MTPSAKALPAICIAVLLTLPVWALESDTQQPINIEADRMTLDETRGVSRYEGHVRLSQGSIQVQADTLELRNNNGRLQSMLISGQQQPARFEQRTGSNQLVRGQAMRIEYDATRSQLIMLESAELLQGSNLIRSDRIDYNIKTNNLSAGNNGTTGKSPSGGTPQRVHIVITPDANKQANP